MTAALSPRRESLPAYRGPVAVASAVDLVMLKRTRGRGSYVRRSDLAALVAAPTRRRAFVYRADLAAVPTAQNSEEMIRVDVARVAAEVLDASPPDEDCPSLRVVMIGRSDYARRSDLLALLAHAVTAPKESES